VGIKAIWKSLSKPTYFTHALNIVLAYFVGLLLGNLILLPFTGVLALALVIGGSILALPLLFIALIIVPFIKSSLEKNLKLWCVIATITIPIAWLILEYSTNYSNRTNITNYLSYRNVWERALLALFCAASSAMFFYNRTKRILNS